MSSLTTTFTPAAACTNAGIAHIQVNEVQYFLLQGPPASSTDCFPEGYDPDRTAVYAPGICPSGYTEACSQLGTFATITETTFTCCPTQLKHSCLTNTNKRYSWQSTLACYSTITTEADGQWTISAVTRVSNGTTQIADETGTETFGAVNAHGVQVKVWDGAFPTSTSAHTTRDQIATAIQTGTPDTTGRESPVSPVASKGLSSGAAAGIGIGAGAAVILAGLLGFWILKRRRRDKHAVASKEQPVQPIIAGWGELPAELKQPFVRHEMEGDHQYPYKPGDPPRELDTSR
ncbi:hypothetical protein LX32DRAFT_645018 [Colletotrichum zoysiae]|uniref:Uncharacterized protein n=1 Tax=Colletotrichum zoysiae TaxID=1216348 RepID=A0AAD9H7Y0_9PEZI|nr:hypothetical protein LX32DRAFT_645018 [Colletotrichum zoysiae]